MSISEAALHLQAGGVIIFPTEGLYGFSCNIYCAEAIARIIEIKQRASNKGLIVIADSLERVEPLIDLQHIHADIDLKQLWPGHNTLIFDLNPKANLSPLLSGQYNSLAIRVSNFAPLRELIATLDAPIVSSSVNISRQEALQDLTQIKADFASLVDYIEDSACGGIQAASRIIDARYNKVIR